MRRAPDPYFPTHGDDRYAVEHYDLDLDYKLASNRLSGRARLRVRALADTPDLRLDLAGLQASKITVGGQPPKRTRTDARSLTVVTPQPLAAGQRIEIEIGYAGKPSGVSGPFGPAGWEELEDGALVASQPYGAPSWYPCNDYAGDKATYRIALSTDPGYEVIANGTPEATLRSGARRVKVWNETHPMAPYAAVVHIGRYATTDLGGGVLLVAPPAVRRAGTPFERLPAMIDTLAGWFGPYPFDAYRCVVTPDALEIPLEAQGLASFGSNFVRTDWDAERLVVHELAHQWFGCAVTAPQGADIWLHEGFACYTEWLWSEQRGLATADDRARDHWTRLARTHWAHPLQHPGVRNMFDDAVYKRGALLLHALRGRLGDAAFLTMLRAWVDAHRYGCVDTAAFRAHAATYTPDDLTGFFDAWLGEGPLPVLTAR